MKQRWNDKTERWEPPTNADRIRGMSDENLVKFLASVFCAGMLAEERGEDFQHSFPWTLDRLRQPVGDKAGDSL